jgi:hypothetical protein
VSASLAGSRARSKSREDGKQSPQIAIRMDNETSKQERRVRRTMTALRKSQSTRRTNESRLAL